MDMRINEIGKLITAAMDRHRSLRPYKFNRAWGQWEDLHQECWLYYLTNKHHYNRKKGKQSTWIFACVDRVVRHWCWKFSVEQRIMECVELINDELRYNYKSVPKMGAILFSYVSSSNEDGVCRFIDELRERGVLRDGLSKRGIVKRHGVFVRRHKP